MRSIIISVLIGFIIITTGFQTFGKEMTNEQKEIWAEFEAGWADIIKGDLQSVIAGRHDSYLNLSSGNPTPINKDQIQKREERWLEGDYKPTSFEIKPITISIIDDVAIVFYWHKWGTDNGFSQKGRSMVTLIKQDNKWVAIGVMSASCEKPAPCPYEF